MNGKVKWFNNEKGYGFIEGDDGVDYFVHHSALADGLTIKENDSVSFDAVQTERGKQAQNVKVGSEGSEADAGDESPADEEDSE